MTKPAPKWIYDRAEGRYKHCWKRPEPGFQPGHRGPVGKCSSLITDVVATELVNTGIHDAADEVEQEDGRKYSSKIYNVHNGAIYVAVPTMPGVSYHGYPVQGRLSRKLLGRLRERATELDCLKAFEKWVREYIS
jgi:hypothetical protein